jgi:hypothetical protein
MLMVACLDGSVEVAVHGSVLPVHQGECERGVPLQSLSNQPHAEFGIGVKHGLFGSPTFTRIVVGGVGGPLGGQVGGQGRMQPKHPAAQPGEQPDPFGQFTRLLPAGPIH